MDSDQDGDLPAGHPSPPAHQHSHREAQVDASTVAHHTDGGETCAPHLERHVACAALLITLPKFA